MKRYNKGADKRFQILFISKNGVSVEMTSSSFIQVQITYPNVEEAKSAAKTLVERRLVACAQILPQIESRYVWQGKTNVDVESLLLCKTRATLFNRLAEVVAAEHSYECPQIVGVPLQFVAPSYRDWLDEQIAEN